ncbi:hypothetical protein YC2023_046662 [Brassica napus]
MISLEQITAYNQSITSDFHAAVSDDRSRGREVLKHRLIDREEKEKKLGAKETRPKKAILEELPPPGNTSRRQRHRFPVAKADEAELKKPLPLGNKAGGGGAVKTSTSKNRRTTKKDTHN